MTTVTLNPDGSLSVPAPFTVTAPDFTLHPADGSPFSIPQIAALQAQVAILQNRVAELEAKIANAQAALA